MADNIQNLISGSDKNLEKALKTNLLNDAEANISLPVYTKEVKQIKPLRASAGLGGFVRADQPGIVNINPNSMFSTQETLGHEAEHLKQIEAKKFIEDAMDKKDYPKNFDILGVGSAGGYKNLNRSSIISDAKKAKEKYKDKYGLSGSFAESEKEFMADLIGLEVKLPKGQSVLDTDIGKDIFNTPEKRHYFLASSFPNTAKMLEIDPNMFLVAAQKAKLAMQEFKDKSLYDSYFNAALSALKKLSGG
jgi:hypothetical protein